MSHFSYRAIEPHASIGMLILQCKYGPTMTTPAPPVRKGPDASAPLPPWSRQALRVIATLGLLAPWFFNLRYFASGGSVLPQVFFGDATANALTTAITVDVYLAAAAFGVWIFAERRVTRPWVYLLACFGLGLSFALPLYLLRRRPGRVS